MAETRGPACGQAGPKGLYRYQSRLVAQPGPVTGLKQYRYQERYGFTDDIGQIALVQKARARPRKIGRATERINAAPCLHFVPPIRGLIDLAAF